MNENVIEQNKFRETLNLFLDDFITQTFGHIIEQSNQGVKKYTDNREHHFAMIKEAEKHKQEEAERKAFEKKRKEIEKLRKAKLNLIRVRMETNEPKEMETINVYDIHDKNSGL